jgi:poly(A) polymerase
MTETLSPARQAQILTGGVNLIMDALRAAGGEARVVGGAVRDAVMGRAIGDIDLAANLPPERVMDILAARHIRSVPTGLAHGTVTAVIDHAGYEITSLRRDVETDGRHAQIAYTDDWQTDAARRDFTFNALYLDADGKLYDYFGGASDAATGQVRFIGDARARIREDVLRILRFFRFHAWIGRGDANPQALEACAELAGLIPHLSAQRVARELLKLLGAPHPWKAWQLMFANGIARFILPECIDGAGYLDLLRNEEEQGQRQPALARLAALLPRDETIAEAVAARLKFSNRDASGLTTLAKLPALLDSQLANPTDLRRVLYEYGVPPVRSALFLIGGHSREQIEATLGVIDAWENPVFPIRGEDIVQLGVPMGPRVGEILRSVEQWWIAGDFRAERDICLAQARRYGKNH